jgi:hypothetical protein
MNAPFPIPEGVEYDGPMTGLPRPLHLFTDHETKSSFGIPMAVPSVEAITTERDRIRAAFRAEAPEVREPEQWRPLHQRRLRDFVPVDISNHY